MNFLSSIHNVRQLSVATGSWSALNNTLNTTGKTAMVDVSGNVYVGHGNSLGTYKFAAVWNISTLAWNAFGVFTINDGSVNCFAQDASRSRIYFGGGFTSIDSVSNYFIRLGVWNYSTARLDRLDTGINAECRALVCDPSRNFVYIGGDFTSAGGTGNRNYIIRWNANNGSWETMGTGLNGRCCTIALDSSGNVYVGGEFSTAGGVSANYMAFRNITTNTWSALGSGLNSRVNAIVFDSINNALYVGGPFTTAGGISASAVAKWNITTSTWSALGSGLGTVGLNDGMNEIVYCMALSSTGKLYVGGTFTSAGGVSVTNIAVWDPTTSTWSAMGTGLSGGVGTRVYSISIDNTRKIVYAVGQFTSAGGVSATGTARWSGGGI